MENKDLNYEERIAELNSKKEEIYDKISKTRELLEDLRTEKESRLLYILGRLIIIAVIFVMVGAIYFYLFLTANPTIESEVSSSLMIISITGFSITVGLMIIYYYKEKEIEQRTIERFNQKYGSKE